MNGEWEDDWLAFVEYVAALLREGRSTEELTEIFDGKGGEKVSGTVFLASDENGS